MNFGKRLKRLRQSKDLTQKELAEVFHTTHSSIGRYEKGESFPSADLLNDMANYFNVSTDYLLDRPSKEPTKFKSTIDELVKEFENEDTLMFLKDGEIDEETAELIKIAMKNAIEMVDRMKVAKNKPSN